MKRRDNIGPYSHDSAINNLDGRTKLGKALAGIRAALIEHIGGEPSVAEALLVDVLAIKALRLQLGAERAVETATDSDGHNWLSWSESLRRDLLALGLQPRKDAPLDLRTYLKERDAS